MGTKKSPEILIISDDRSWVWSLINQTLEEQSYSFVRMTSELNFRESWHRWKNAPRMIFHWETKSRSAGSMVEEIKEIDREFDVGDKIIVATTNPTFEDVVYFSELNIKRIIKLGPNKKEQAKAQKELFLHLTSPCEKKPSEHIWRQLNLLFDHYEPGSDFEIPSEDQINYLNEKLLSVVESTDDFYSARHEDALAHIAFLSGDYKQAEEHWRTAFDLNPKFYRSANKLAQLFTLLSRSDEAMAIHKRMYAANRDRVSRLVSMGNICLQKDEVDRAESFFSNALEKDSQNSGALNGMATIRFHQGDLDVARALLSKSDEALSVASSLNEHGIKLVGQKHYKEALEHYIKAQYVLPNQEKGPMLFYNIGLCYYRWGKMESSLQYLNIALIKDPEYSKASRLKKVVNHQLKLNTSTSND